MSDLTLGLVGLTTLVGYMFSKGNGDKDNGVSVKGNMPQRSSVENFDKPSGADIYSSNRVNEVNDEVLKASLANYSRAENPAETGVLPPIYNSYSAVGNAEIMDPSLNTSLLNENALKEMYKVNRNADVTATGTPPPIDNRPMFQSLMGTGKGTPDKSMTEPTSAFDNSITAAATSLLTGLPLDNNHNNMVPFFGSNVKQNLEEFGNEPLLERYTQQSSTFRHKKEVEPFFNTPQQDIYGVNYTSSVSQDRFVPSLFRQNEKPFDPERIPAPIAGTVDNKILPQFKDVDDLRSANKPKESYKARTVAGQFGNVRGVQGKQMKYTPDMSFEQTPDMLLRTTGEFIAPKVQPDYAPNMKNTSRQSQNLEYHGPANPNPNTTKQQQRITASESSFDAMAAPSKRQNFGNDWVRNVGGFKDVNDYGKTSTVAYSTERQTTGQQSHVLNVNQEGSGSMRRYDDTIRSTIKETTLGTDTTRNVKTQFDKGCVAAWEMGVVGIDAKPTQKESTITNNYKGIINKEDGMGYLVTKYEAKTTGKESITASSNYTGNGGGSDGMKNHTIYSTYDDPVKTRDATHVKDYQGNASFASESSSRTKFGNAQIRETKEAALMGSRPSGPQTFQTASGAVSYGETKLTDNMLLKEQRDKRGYQPSLPSVVPGKELIGQLDHQKLDNKKIDTIAADRLQPDLIKSQLKNNPYSIYEKN